MVPLAHPGPCRCVLVVDDDASIRQLVRMLLLRDRGAGEIDVREARDGHEAIEVTADVSPDVILLDVDMPGMDGITALPALREAAPGARILMFSGHADRRDEAIAAGAHGWVSKAEWRELLPTLLAAAS